MRKKGGKEREKSWLQGFRNRMSASNTRGEKTPRAKFHDAIIGAISTTYRQMTKLRPNWKKKEEKGGKSRGSKGIGFVLSAVKERASSTTRSSVRRARGVERWHDAERPRRASWQEQGCLERGFHEGQERPSRHPQVPSIADCNSATSHAASPPRTRPRKWPPAAPLLLLRGRTGLGLYRVDEESAAADA